MWKTISEKVTFPKNGQNSKKKHEKSYKKAEFL